MTTRHPSPQRAAESRPFVYVVRSAIQAGRISTIWAARKSRKYFGAQVKTTFVESVPATADAERVIRQLAAAGNQLIFTTSFGYMEPTLKVAKLFPKTRL